MVRCYLQYVAQLIPNLVMLFRASSCTIHGSCIPITLAQRSLALFSHRHPHGARPTRPPCVLGALAPLNKVPNPSGPL